MICATAEPNPDSPSHPAENLAEAFRLFNRVSAELTDAYTSLQNQVEALTAELAEANGELRRQYQEKARLSERLALLLDALPAGVVVLDHDGAVEQSNPAAEAIVGVLLPGRDWRQIGAARFTPTEMPGEWIVEGTPSSPEALPASQNPGTPVNEPKRIALTETQLDSAGGRIVLLHDITANHRMKRQAERNEHLAAMGEMAAAVAHQLRTPLAAALLYTGNLARPEIGPEDRIKLTDKAVARLKHLERLIQDMLVFARGESAGREWFDAAGLVVELVQIVEPLARERDVAFRAAAGVDVAQIHGDRKAVLGAFLNLLENALQACQAGGCISFQATLDGGQLAFRVRDDGRGIDPGARNRLFEPFFTTRAAGTGLGLAIARGVFRAHGGAIELAQGDGGGAEFLVQLPCRLKAAAGASQVPTESTK
jgi:two-component system, sensor histidine kinase FlrB